MSDFSLRLPYLVYLAIGSVLVGVLIAPLFRDMPPLHAELPTMAMEGHEHGTLDIPAAGAPDLAMQIVEDPMAGWNVTLAVENFTFAPASAGEAHVANTGHAHLYLNGTKIARLYGPHFHLPDLPPGQHQITASLSTNDHAYFTVDGERIEARAAVFQGEEPTAAE